jgi:hypothetical protein
MKQADFARTMLNLASYCGCQQEGPREGPCFLCRERGYLPLWSVHLRNGTTILGRSICVYDEAARDFVVHDGKALIVIPISEIVALGVFANPEDGRGPEQTTTNGHDLTAIRKEIGRLYGIVKDLERDA